ncbi:MULTISPECIES: hypothetical protein [unclassified Gilliamella]|nr:MULTISPECIES: hypothetical protein [unclassified Gilliamella]MBI0113527.1 hypothetical protein [Gilliamella sp. W8123]MBI0116936.1 hypothetical protein [Gilliamella sp. W8129]
MTIKKENLICDYYSIDEIMKLLSNCVNTISLKELIYYIQNQNLNTMVMVEGNSEFITKIGSSYLDNHLPIIKSPSWLAYNEKVLIKNEYPNTCSLEDSFIKIDFLGVQNLSEFKDLRLNDKFDISWGLSQANCKFYGLFDIPYETYLQNCDLYNNLLSINFDNVFFTHFSSTTKSNDISINLCLATPNTTKNQTTLPIIKLDFSQIYIAKDELLRFMKNHKISFKKTINDEDEIDQLKKENEELKKKLEQLENKSTSNKMKVFIKSLLYVHYDENVANSPRKEIYDQSSGSGKDGVIQKTFDKKRIDVNVSGKTVESWLKNVDIPFIKK